ncbi:MAG: hypothetical protein HWN65_11380 [Candidatus Helarchaeota archaeon]|nr:hypothetical protein [Candidatus Helarchaeota archaeon]
MLDLDEILKCKEHEAPYLICNFRAKKGTDVLLSELTVICPVDQQIETISNELPLNELENLYFPIADKIFRCEKCFREAEILDTAITKKKVTIFLSCPEHGRLITREISPIIYDKIRFLWDTKDIKEEKEQIY